MSERKGKIVAYFPANRQGKIQPDDKGPAALFYLPAVSNADPEPKVNDIVEFSAPSPRKNKKGKMVQDPANSVTITERAPEPSPEELAREAKRAARAQDKGRGNKGAGRRGKSRQAPGSRDSGERRGRSSSAEPRATRSPRSADEKNSRGKKKQPNRNNAAKPSIRSKVRYPSARDVGKNVFHIEYSNPALVAKKFIQWPTPAEPKPEEDSWRLSERNQNFFLTRTLAPLYRNFEKKSLPWSAIRARREAVVRAMEQSGFHIASEIVRGPWRFGVAQEADPILTTSSVYLDRVYGYPIIPAHALRKLLLQVITTDDTIPEAVSSALVHGSQEVRCCILDSVPSGKIGTLTIERCVMLDSAAALATASDSEPSAAAGSSTDVAHRGKSSHAICMGDDAGMVCSVALSGPGLDRNDAQNLLRVLVDALRQCQARSQELKAPVIATKTDKTPKETGVAIQF